MKNPSANVNDENEKTEECSAAIEYLWMTFYSQDFAKIQSIKFSFSKSFLSSPNSDIPFNPRHVQF